jgi:hypothetical protein
VTLTDEPGAEERRKKKPASVLAADVWMIDA